MLTDIFDKHTRSISKKMSAKNKSKPVFTVPIFDFENVDENNENAWKEIERISQTGDDRSKTILAGIMVEHYLDRLLKLLFIDYKFLTDRSDYTFSFRISILKSLRLIPNNIITMCDCVRKVRNEFAHNLTINRISEIDKKIQSQIHQLYIENVKKPIDIELIKKLESIYRLGWNYLRTYEQNIKLLREIIDDPEFEKELRGQNLKEMFEMHERLIAEGPIKTVDRGNKIEEIYPKALRIIRSKKN